MNTPEHQILSFVWLEDLSLTVVVANASTRSSYIMIAKINFLMIVLMNYIYNFLLNSFKIPLRV